MSTSDEIRDSMEKMENDGKVALPVYIAVDHSWSMGPQGNDAIDAANSLIPTILDACAENPIADDRARFCVIGFNNTAKVVSPLARGTNLQPHTFEADGGTAYAGMFELLRHQIEADAATLKADGYQTYRPAVFLITDGEPTDDPSAAFAALTDPNWLRRPNISVFGVGNGISEEIIKPYVSGKGRAFATRSNAEAGEALGGFIGLLMQSVLNSAQNNVSAESGDGQLKDVLIWDEDSIEEAQFLEEIGS